MSNRVKLISWILLALAVCMWGGVFYAAQMIRTTAIERSNDTKTALTKANQATINQRVQALADSTEEKRNALAALAGVDVVSIIDVIDAVGKASGIDAKVSDAAVSGTQQLGKNGDTLRGLVFNVQGTGSFEQVMHAAQLYERLPLLATLDQLDIEKIQTTDKKAPQWHIAVRIRVQTLIPLSI